MRITLDGGIRIKIDSTGHFVKWAEASLPRLLFGTNGRLIENQEQLVAALQKLLLLLSTKCIIPEISKWNIYRLDFCWNFAFTDCTPRALIVAHRPFLIPGMRKGGTLHSDDEGVSWRGAKSRIKFCFYDKAKKMRVRGSVLRAELSLYRKELEKRLAGRVWWEWDNLWTLFCDFMVSIPSVVRPIKAHGWQEAVGLLSLECQERVLANLSHKSSKTVRRYRQRIAVASMTIPQEFSWSQVLMGMNQLKAVHIEPSVKRGKISTLKLND